MRLPDRPRHHEPPSAAYRPQSDNEAGDNEELQRPGDQLGYISRPGEMTAGISAGSYSRSTVGYLGEDRVMFVAIR